MRKLLMLAAVALAAMAFAGVSATSASADAPFKFFTHGLEAFCPEVSLQDGEVSGGCLTEDFEGTVQLGVFNPYWTPVGNYAVTFDLVVDSDGDGYAVNPTVNAIGGAYPRKAGDEADGSPLPWAVNSRSPDWFELELDVTVGITVASNPPGGSCSQQQIATAATQIGGGSSTELDQLGASANLQFGHWESPDDMWIDWDYY
jgi:ABC-type sugar transport system substrate-binding protein